MQELEPIWIHLNNLVFLTSSFIKTWHVFLITRITQGIIIKALFVRILLGFNEIFVPWFWDVLTWGVVGKMFFSIETADYTREDLAALKEEFEHIEQKLRQTKDMHDQIENHEKAFDQNTPAEDIKRMKHLRKDFKNSHHEVNEMLDKMENEVMWTHLASCLFRWTMKTKSNLLKLKCQFAVQRFSKL